MNNTGSIFRGCLSALMTPCDAHARVRAAELHEALAVLSAFDAGPDLVLHYRHLMVLEGHPEYATPLNGADTLAASQRAYVEAQWRLFRAWWADWTVASEGRACATS